MRMANSMLNLPSNYRAYTVQDDGHAMVVPVSKEKADMQLCPHCRKKARGHGSVVRRVYHLPTALKPCILKIKVRRYRCPKCAHVFKEPVEIISQTCPHISVDLELWILEQLKGGASFADIEGRCKASKDMIQKVTDACRVKTHWLPRVLCIDEFHAFSRRTAYSQTSCEMLPAITDGESGIMAEILRDRTPETLDAHFASFNEAERRAVKFFVCDMYDTYINAARRHFPEAVICIDKFHAVRAVKDAFADARRRLQKGAGNGRDIKKHARLLEGNRAKLCSAPPARRWQSQDALDAQTASERRVVYARINEALMPDDAKHQQLRIAYLLLQLFYEWANADFKDEEATRWALGLWISQAQDCPVPEMRRAANTIKKYKVYIVNAYRHGYTNAVAESLNRRVKEIKRSANGFASFEHMRKRCLIALGLPRIPDYITKTAKNG